MALTGVSDGLAVILGIITTHFSRKMTVGGAQLASGTLLLLVLAVPHSKYSQGRDGSLNIKFRWTMRLIRTILKFNK